MSDMRLRVEREGYEPPSIAPKLPPVALSTSVRLSPSPSRQADVPPAVPSPPTETSRTSPPRPTSHPPPSSSPANSASTQPPPQASPQRTNQWLFTSDEVVSTPSIIHGLSRAEERLRRVKGINFIYQAGILLDLPQITLWVAAVFFHRFYMRMSMVEEKRGIHQYNIAATSLFLANKTEENCRKTKDIIIAVAKVAQKNNKLVIDEQSKEYWRWRDSILTYEELMLETLTFDVTVDNPYQNLYDHLDLLHLLRHKALRDTAWTFCNDGALTALPLLMDARDISVAAIFYASSVRDEKIDDRDGKPWWKVLDGNEDLMIRAVDIMNELYRENPLNRKNAPKSPRFHLESTRRRGVVRDGESSSENVSPLSTAERGATASPVDDADARSSARTVAQDQPDEEMAEAGAEAEAEPEISTKTEADGDGEAEAEARMEDEGEVEEDEAEPDTATKTEVYGEDEGEVDQGEEHEGEEEEEKGEVASEAEAADEDIQTSEAEPDPATPAGDAASDES